MRLPGDRNGDRNGGRNGDGDGDSAQVKSRQAEAARQGEGEGGD